MLLRIGTREYDVMASLQEPTLNDLYYLKVKTKSVDFPQGISLKTLPPILSRFKDFTDPTDFIDDAEALLALRAVVFLCRQHAGEKHTLDGANDFPINQLSFIHDDEDELEAAQQQLDPPQAPTVSDRGADEPTAPIPTAS